MRENRNARDFESESDVRYSGVNYESFSPSVALTPSLSVLDFDHRISWLAYDRRGYPVAVDPGPYEALVEARTGPTATVFG